MIKQKKRTRSYGLYKALSAIDELTAEELILLKKTLSKKEDAPKTTIFEEYETPQNDSFFLFGKWPDFEDAEILRRKAWTRNCI